MWRPCRHKWVVIRVTVNVNSAFNKASCNFFRTDLSPIPDDHLGNCNAYADVEKVVCKTHGTIRSFDGCEETNTSQIPSPRGYAKVVWPSREVWNFTKFSCSRLQVITSYVFFILIGVFQYCQVNVHFFSVISIVKNSCSSLMYYVCNQYILEKKNGNDICSYVKGSSCPQLNFFTALIIASALVIVSDVSGTRWM